MYGEKTLFVVGSQHALDVVKLAAKNQINHIYCGANQSFELSENGGTYNENADWENMIQRLLKEGFWVTFDFDVKYTEWVAECCFTETNRFIPMISVKLPYIEQLGYNACLKLDDKDFDASNPGVWTHRLHNLKDPQVFTDWSKYTKDETLD
jgi:hypothetical protein